MRVKTVLLYAVIVILTLAAGEGLARIYDWSPAAFDGSSGDRLGPSRYYHSTLGGGDLVPNQDGHWVIWFHRPYHVQSNSLGFRNTEEASDKAFKILALGDSQTFGVYVANEDTWPGWTENELRQKLNSNEKVQVFNAGIAGYSIGDELALLRDKGAAFKPDLVVLGVFENDLYDLRKAKGQRPPNTAEARLTIWLKSLARSSALVSLANQVKGRLQFAAAGVDVRRGEGEAVSRDLQPVSDIPQLSERYAALFRETVALLRSQSIPLAVVFIPSAQESADEPPSETERLIRSLTSDMKVPYLDLTPVMRAPARSTARFYLLQRIPGHGYRGNAHMSREGHAEVGVAVADWLLEQKLLPQ
ncbi:MAG: SGNH/GDSL hydrolase family protein [Pseudorhodoplanes sp.]